MQPRRRSRMIEGHRNKYLVIIVAVVFIVVAILTVRNDNRMVRPVFSSAPNMDASITSNSKIRYNPTVVEGTFEKPLIIRFAAQESGDGSSGWRPMSTNRWIDLMSHQDTPLSVTLAESFISILADTKMNAFFFETKGVTYESARDKSFEFVLVQNQYLFNFADARHDSVTFAEHLRTIPKDEVGCVFTNLGGDSTLIAPKGLVPGSNVYGHLAAFARRAPKDQQLKFWKLATKTLWNKLKHDKNKTWWFSTDGSDVAWLHVRIDPRPKYYDYQPFARESG